MLIYLFLTITLLIAYWALSLAGRLKSKFSYSRLLLAISIAAFIYLYGTWVFLSVYLRYVFAVAFIILLVYNIMRRKPQTVHKTSGAKSVANSIGTGAFLLLIILYYTGTTGKPYGVANLSLPFKRGSYFVFQGGKGLPTNLFHYGLRTAIYAMDIIKLNQYGNRADKVFSTTLTDYRIYDDTLYAPCNGRVAHTASNNPDNIPPNHERGPTNTNHILIETDSTYIFMGHLKPGCVFVKEGDSVTVGQPIACCGNSGFSLEPHLHIQAHTNSHTGLMWYKEQPLLIQFSGKSYLLFEQIKAGK